MAAIDSSPNPERRSFLKRASAATLGALALLSPVAVGVRTFLAPLRRQNAVSDGMVRVAVLSALPLDGTPRKFPIVASRQDVWTHYPQAPVGAVYLRRVGGEKVEALSVICPHAGCFVDYAAERKGFLCPCHNSTFAVDGKVNDPRSPSSRALDQLDTEIRHGEEVWVRFERFRTGVAGKVPI